MLCFLGFFVFGVLLRHWLDTHDEMERPLREAIETAGRRWRLHDGDVLNRAATRWDNWPDNTDGTY